ncbi:ceramide synthase 4-like [Suncus etruscus]|uniref:ceramide synthase 4-like n=1 Tax=Suncus etruscus TaxID=109475 RepID=UPI00210FE8C5|nr:ceramide synthase 4-like [Suncus etruscus]
MWSSLSEWFWWEKLWLPSNVTWADLEDRDGQVYPHPQDLLAALPVALTLLALRFAFDRFIALPLSYQLGMRDKLRQIAKPIPALERHFITAGPKPKEAQLALLATQCGLTLYQTQRWFCRRRNQDRTPLSKKFCEASWNFTYFLCCFLGGFSILYHEPWLWRPVMCWDSYPNQPLKPILYRWYLLELGFYISLLIMLPFDIKRKDFKDQVAHHFVTIPLMVFTYSCNMLRMAFVVLLLHECSEILLEACKMFNYMQYQKVSNVLFIIFACVFFYTRLVVFPTQVLYSTYYKYIVGRSPYFGYYFLNWLLMMLQVMHVYWFYLILRMLYSFTLKGKLKDVRSDVEESDSSEDDMVKKNPPLKSRVAHRPGETMADGCRNWEARPQNSVCKSPYPGYGT